MIAHVRQSPASSKSVLGQPCCVGVCAARTSLGSGEHSMRRQSMHSVAMEGRVQQLFASSQVRTAAEVKGRSVGVMSTATAMRPIMKRSTL